MFFNLVSYFYGPFIGINVSNLWNGDRQFATVEKANVVCPATSCLLGEDCLICLRPLKGCLTWSIFSCKKYPLKLQEMSLQELNSVGDYNSRWVGVLCLSVCVCLSVYPHFFHISRLYNFQTLLNLHIAQELKLLYLLSVLCKLGLKTHFYNWIFSPLSGNLSGQNRVPYKISG